MPDFRRVINGSRSEVLAHLGEQSAMHASHQTGKHENNGSAASYVNTYERGWVDGLTYAAHVVRDWKPAPDLAQLAALLAGISDELTAPMAAGSLAEEVVQRADQRDRVRQEIRNVARLLREADVNG